MDDRTQIAAMAMQAFIEGAEWESVSYEKLAEDAVGTADALLAELAKPKETKP